MADTTAVATRGPTPGICWSRRQAASLLATFSRSSLKLSICSCRCFHSCQRKSNKRRMGRQSLVGVLQNLRHLPAQAGRPFPKADPALQQESPNLIDDARAALDQPLPYPMQSLQVELVLRLD